MESLGLSQKDAHFAQFRDNGEVELRRLLANQGSPGK